MSKVPDDVVEKAAIAICRSGKFECGLGRCASICADTLGNKPKQCSHALAVHGSMALAACQIAYDAGRRDEREECAKVAMGQSTAWVNAPATTSYGSGYQRGCEHAADAIRARGD